MASQVTPKEQIAAIRCSKCGRAPTDEEQIDMFVLFGHKLKEKPPRHGEKLVWKCQVCFSEASNGD